MAISAVLFGASAMIYAQERSGSFPLAVGNYWIYECYFTEAVPGQILRPQTIHKTWRSEIRQVVYRAEGPEANGPASAYITAAVFDNSPRPLFGDLLSDDTRFPTIVISVNSRRFYEITHWNSAFPDVLRRVQDHNDNLSDVLRYAQILDLPLALGKAWGEPPFPWRVEQRKESLPIGVRGVGATLNRKGFVIRTSSNTGSVSFTFVPGIGITHVFSESLFPRGDPNHLESEATLIEVHLNQKAVGAR